MDAGDKNLDEYQPDEDFLGKRLHDRHVPLASPLEGESDVIEIVHGIRLLMILRVRCWHREKSATKTVRWHRGGKRNARRCCGLNRLAICEELVFWLIAKRDRLL